MNGLFSLYAPGDSVFHRLPVGWKYLIMFAATFVGLLLRNPWVSLGVLAAVTLALTACGVGLRHALGLPPAVWLTAGFLLAYQIAVGAWATGVVVACNLVGALYASRILTATTPGPVLVDALVAAARPLRFVGADPERIGLAVMLMARSLPMMWDAFGQVRDAARARGRERNYFALVAPVVVRAVGYAQATGEALMARGLGERRSR
ncbi:MAG: energy-coupling factor transporter transmembrane protein EcfT [Propionibacteriaceae bacterium]|nr:energy-coupling factor transporter transmembrane protein EcfT [Propionibacteriaceae bacterium]